MRRRKEFRQFVHLDDPAPEQICYLLHLDPPYIPEGADDDPSKWAGHYLGTSDDFPRRGMQEHGTAHGPRILQVQQEAGGSWHLVRTWQGGRAKEKQLKTHAGKHYCPEPQCAGDRAIPGDNPPRQGAKYLSRKQRRVRQAVREAQANYPAPQLRQDAGLSHAEAQALLAGPKSVPEPMSPQEELRRIEQLEASWRIPQRPALPKVRDLELETG